MAGQFLMLADDHFMAFFHRAAFCFRSKAEDVDLRGGRGDSLIEKFFTQQGIDHSALTCVEFANHHQKEQVIQLRDGPFQRLKVSLKRKSAYLIAEYQIPDPPIPIPRLSIHNSLCFVINYYSTYQH